LNFLIDTSCFLHGIGNSFVGVFVALLPLKTDSVDHREKVGKTTKEVYD